MGTSSAGTEAFRWTAGEGLVGLGALPGPGFASFGVGVSGDGAVVVGGSFSNNGLEAFRWTAGGGMVGLGDLPGGAFESLARATSANGQVVVGFASASVGPDAFIWDAGHGMRSLSDVLTNNFGEDLTGWELTEATDISADGTVIVGYGINPSGQPEGWMATIPEPTTAAILALGTAVIGRRRKRSS